ncbi:MAG: SRPBCC domain-containing protein [Bryobacteraceae bacterium]|nr:SRPBCC domain-containing protein [Bryobacteraceae bacterium]
MKSIILGLLLTATVGTAVAEVAYEAEHERVLRREVVVNATLDDVWSAWTTSEGAKRFFAPHARIEPVLGGAYEIHFSPQNPEGTRGCEGCKVHSVQPKSLLRFTWNAPPASPLRKAGLFTLVTLRFRELKPGKVSVHFEQSGWGDGPEWDALYGYFSKAWDRVLPRFVQACESGAGR